MSWQRRNAKLMRVLDAAHLTCMAVNLTLVAMPGLVDVRTVLQELEGNGQRHTVKRTTRSPAPGRRRSRRSTRHHRSSSSWVRVPTLAPAVRHSHTGTVSFGRLRTQWPPPSACEG